MRNERENTHHKTKEDNQATPPSYETYLHYIQGVDLSPWAERRLIPRSAVFGTQRADEYCGKKRRAIKKAFRTDPNFLFNNPAIICAIGGNGSIQPTTIDGHHRTRYAPKETTHIPAWVFSPNEFVECINRYLPEGTTPLHVESFVDRLKSHVSEALDSFSRTMPVTKQPHVVAAENINRFKNMFPSF